MGGSADEQNRQFKQLWTFTCLNLDEQQMLMLTEGRE